MEMVEFFKDGELKRRKFANTAQGKMEGEKFAAEKRKEGIRVKESKKDREKRYQDHDQRELDKNKPSEEKIKKVKVVDDEIKFKGKSSIGGHDPGLNVYQVRGD